LEFYRISDETIRQYKEKEGFLMEKKKALPTKSWQRNVWLFCEEPDSSKAAKVMYRYYFRTNTLYIGSSYYKCKKRSVL